MIVNFPSNPTAQVVTLDFYKEIVVFAKKYIFFGVFVVVV
jgi:alanine-synthesizing transaminase